MAADPRRMSGISALKRQTVAAILLLFSVMLAGCGTVDMDSNGGMLGTAGAGGGGAAGGGGGVGGSAGSTGVGGGGAGGVLTREVVELDPSFGDDGIRIFSMLDTGWSSESARAVAVMPDDRIVVTGSKSLSSFGSSYGFVAVLDDDGALDTSFGELGDGHAAAIFDDSTELSAVTVDSSGRIVVGGWSRSLRWGDEGAFTAARYLQDGSLDPSFGNLGQLPGVVRLTGPCVVAATDLALQNDGRIVATGHACESSERLSVVRLLPDGTPDAAFGDNGVLLLGPGYGDEVLVSSDGLGATRILVGGSVGAVGLDGNMDFVVSALSDDGALDPAFGEEGVRITDFGDGSPGRSESLAALAHRPGGGFLAAGWAQLLPNFSEPWAYAYDFLVAAYDSAGALDASFGEGGFTFIDFGEDAEEAVEVLLRTNGNIAVVGQSRPTSEEHAIAIAHLGPDGAPVDGEHKTLTEVDDVALTAAGAALDNQGRLLVTGKVVHEGGGVDVFVARYVFRAVE